MVLRTPLPRTGGSAIQPERPLAEHRGSIGAASLSLSLPARRRVSVPFDLVTPLGPGDAENYVPNDGGASPNGREEFKLLRANRGR